MNSLFTDQEMNQEGIDALVNAAAAQSVGIQRLTNEELEQMPSEVPRPRGPADVRAYRQTSRQLTISVLLDDQFGRSDLLSGRLSRRAIPHLRRTAASGGELRRRRRRRKKTDDRVCPCVSTIK